MKRAELGITEKGNAYIDAILARAEAEKRFERARKWGSDGEMALALPALHSARVCMNRARNLARAECVEEGA